MIRRKFLKSSIGGGALLSLATPAIAQETKTLRMLSTDAASAETLAATLGAVTEGKLKIETTIVPKSDAATMLDQVSGGQADMCLTSLDSFLSKNLAFGLFASMPFGMTTGELEGWDSASDGGEMLSILGQENRVSFRFAGDLGPKPMWSKQPLSDLASFRERAVGSTGLGILNLRQAGIQNVFDLHDPATDLASLDVLDGVSAVEVEQNGLSAAFGHTTISNPNAPSGVLSLAIADATLASLNTEQQLIIERVCSAALTKGRARSFHDNASAFTKLATSITSAPIPEDIWGALSRGAKTLLETIFNEGDTQAQIVDAYVFFLTDIAPWSEIGEAAFYSGRERLTLSL